MRESAAGFFFLLSGFNAWSQEEKWKEWEAEADTLLNHEEFEGALKLYSKIIDGAGPKYKPGNPVFYKRAVCYYSLKNMVSAQKDLDASLLDAGLNSLARPASPRPERSPIGLPQSVYGPALRGGL